MKKKTRILLTLLAVLTVLALFASAVLADNTPYEGSDLPVSESYVLRALRALDEKLTAKIDTLSNDMAKLGTDAPAVTEPAAPVNVGFEVVRLTKGQKIVGAVELILRSGTAEAVCPGADQLADLTGGSDIAGGTSVTRNHLLLVPRDDGRGLMVTSNEAYLMVRGSYTVEN